MSDSQNSKKASKPVANTTQAKSVSTAPRRTTSKAIADSSSAMKPAKPNHTAPARSPRKTIRTPANAHASAEPASADTHLPASAMPDQSALSALPVETADQPTASLANLPPETATALPANNTASQLAKTVQSDTAFIVNEAPTSAANATPAHDDVTVSAGNSSSPAELADTEDFKGGVLPDNRPEINKDFEDTSVEDTVDFDEVRIQLTALQQRIRVAKVPVVIVFEGWDAAGKGTMISKLIEGLDPRGYQVFPIRKPTEEERSFPPMRRYWVNMPAQGDISIFCSSWYREVTGACFESKAARKRLNQSYNEIVNMESQLVCDGTLLIKIFLHIPCKEQKNRLKALESKKSTRWRVDKEDWFQNEHYEDYLRLYDAMIARTHFEGALWHVIRSDNKRSCVKQIYDIVIGAFQWALQDREIGRREWDTPYLPHLDSLVPVAFPQLDTFDPDQALTAPYRPAIDKAQKHLRKLQNELHLRGIPMVILFEGWDAAGKGGVIRRLTSALDARGFDVVPISAPTPTELSHQYLWRFWNSVPRNGEIAVFDRSWYGRVMVERIEEYCTESQWRRAYEEINRFEAELAVHGTAICKIWLQIDQETQLTRFNDRQSSVEKQWKITEDDWRNREKWPLYAVAVNEMLQKTNTACAPWTVVEANNKQYARLKVLQTVIQTIEQRLEADQA